MGVIEAWRALEWGFGGGVVIKSVYLEALFAREAKRLR